MRVLRCSSAVALLVLASPSLLVGQPRGTIVGTVVDETTGEALPGAALSVTGPQVQAVSDANGIFELASVPGGDVAVRVELPGYATVVEQIEVLPDEVTLFQFHLSRMGVAIQGLMVRARGRDAQGATVSEVERGDRSLQTALDLLREQVPGVTVRSRYGTGAGIRIRGASSFVNNDPALYIDGVLIADGGGVSAVHALEQIPGERVRRIRVLHGPSAAARYGDANSGVILVETR